MMGVIAGLQVGNIRLYTPQQFVEACPGELDGEVWRTDEADPSLLQQSVTRPEQRIGPRNMIDHVPHGDDVEEISWQVDIVESTTDNVWETKRLASILSGRWRNLTPIRLPG